MPTHQEKLVLSGAAAIAATALISGIAALAIGPVHAQTANALISEGNVAYRRDECVRAAARYYALQVHYPDWLNSAQKKEVTDRIKWCEKHSSVNAATKADEESGVPQPLEKPDGDLGLSQPANNRCRLYAQIAVAQYQVNQVDGCGYSDARWRDDFRNHYEWCMTQGKVALDRESLARQEGLIACHRH